MLEVDLGRLAVDRAQSPEVKQFGQRMIDDHTQINHDLDSLAGSKNVPLATALDDDGRSEHQKLAALSGADFDRQYMDAMVTYHEQDIAAFRGEAENGKDADVKAFAARTLPTLQDHLQMAHQTEATLSK